MRQSQLQQQPAWGLQAGQKAKQRNNMGWSRLAVVSVKASSCLCLPGAVPSLPLSLLLCLTHCSLPLIFSPHSFFPHSFPLPGHTPVNGASIMTNT